MKEIKDWRNWIMGIIFCGGIVSLLFAFGDPAPQTTFKEWLTTMLQCLMASAFCFGGLYLCIKAWDNSPAD